MNDTYNTPSLETVLNKLNVKFKSTIAAFDFAVSIPKPRTFDSLNQALKFVANYVK